MGLGWVVLMLSAVASAAEVHVSPQGRDANDGSAEAPVASLERARELLRAAGGGTAWLHAGYYFREFTFTLTAADNGTVWRAFADERAVITGGKRVNGWRESALRDGVWEVDLKAQGITDFGRLRRRGFGAAQQPSALELFFRGNPMPLARWPNRGWTYIDATPGGQQGGRFTFTSNRPLTWTKSDDIWVHGYWTWNWADSWEHVAGIDAAAREIRTDPPHGVYGYTPARRWMAVNIVEELDEPGEWYLDRKTGILYFWPPEPVETDDVWVSLLEQPLITIDGATGVEIRGLVLENARGHGVVMRNARQSVVAACTIRNVGMMAVNVQGGAQNAVEYSEIAETGEGAILLSGGDRVTLTASGHRAYSNNIRDYSRWVRTYRPAIQMSGVGQRAMFNHIHSAPHEGIALSGNDHLIEGNDVHTVAWETSDVGAFYAGRDLTWRGNVLRGNFFHNQGNGDVNSVYLDDCLSGVLVENNVFHRAGRSIFIGGGRDNIVRNNVILEGNPAIQVDARGMTWASYWFDGRDPSIMNGLKAVPYQQPPWSERYPELVNVLDDEPAAPKGNVVENNVIYKGRGVVLNDATDRWVKQQGTWVVSEAPDTPAKDAWSRGTQIVNHRVELVRNGRPARVRVVVENLGVIRAEGAVDLWVWPDASVRLPGDATVEYALEPGEMTTREFDVEAGAQWSVVYVGAMQQGSDLRPLPLTITLPRQ
ncbi:MAG: right-handed parallel beta-helix repeat-containing protein [Acidobacteria bacterium]|nr:right-handed parallel beta-helix repeat-containing protein [Acidobacteriota bacterium]